MPEDIAEPSLSGEGSQSAVQGRALLRTQLGIEHGSGGVVLSPQARGVVVVETKQLGRSAEGGSEGGRK